MKTLYTNFLILGMMLAVVTGFASCDPNYYYYYDEDEDIAYTVSGHWFGDLDMYSSSTGEKARGSEIEFYRNGNNIYRGTGVEVDYYYHARPVTNYFNWEVYDGVLYLTFEDPNLDCRIVDYRLSSTYFTGYIEGYDGYNTRFDLRNYDRDWYEYGYGSYTRSAEPTDTVAVVKGIRGCNRK